MTKDEVQQCKTLLENEKIRIEASLSNTEQQIQDAMSEVGGDEVDEANALSNASISIRLKERERHLLEKVRGALKRINDDTYGECLGCGDEIGLKRLLIRPVTTLCILCKEKQESHERSHNVNHQREVV